MSKHDDEHAFGFVAGQHTRSHELGEGNAETQLSLTVDAVAVLLDWRKRAAFRCVADVRHGDRIDSYELEAQPRDLSYRVTNTKTGMIESFDPQSRMLREGNTERPLEVNQLATEPLAARLAFPLSLGIWGRPGDSYRITGATRRENAVIVSLVHQRDTTLTGKLTIDTDRRTAIRLDTPTLGVEYRAIQPDQ